MLRRLSVRTKIMLLLAAPIVALLLIAGAGVQDRLRDAQSARESTSAARVVAAANDVAHELILESQWSQLLQVSDNRMGEAQLQDQRLRTDTAVRQFGLLKPDAAYALEFEDAVGLLSTLEAIRADVDAKRLSSDLVVSSFDRLIDFSTQLMQAVGPTAGDIELLQSVQTLAAVSNVKQTLAELNSSIVRATLTDGISPVERTAALFLADQLTTREELLATVVSAEIRAAYEDLRTKDEVRQNAQFLRDFRQLPNAAFEPALVMNSAVTRVSFLHDELEADVADRALLDATQKEEEARAAALQFVTIVALAIAFALLLAALITRSVVRPLALLTRSTNDLSENKLPRLLEQLQRPDSEDSGFVYEPIEVRSTDEVGQLAVAFNSLQRTTKQVADEQIRMMRKGIGEIFVNLARRNQSLLDRQIEFIDQLESREENPDQLENLFKLDHLATRMRRNAESLLVLAGAEPPRRRGRPVDIADVVRVAIGEVEQFSRITLLALDGAAVNGAVAVDLAHLLSELMENATQFSPPDTPVEIVGHMTRDGSYVISVSDQGIGMSSEQLTDANRTMATPPPLGLALTRSLGFTVIGRLAQRFGIVVRLTASPAGGVSALVTVPATLVTEQAELGTEYAAETRAPAQPLTNRVAPVSSAPAPPTAPGVPTPPSPATVFAPPPAAPPPAAFAPPLAPAASAAPPIASPPITPPVAPAAAAPTPIVSPAIDEQQPAPPALPDGFAASQTGAPSIVRPPGVSSPWTVPGREAPPALAVSLAPVAGPPSAPVADLVPRRDGAPTSFDANPTIAPPASAPLPSRTGVVESTASSAAREGLNRRTPKAPAAPAATDARTTAAPSSRSAEEVRAMLSRYRSGLQGQRPHEPNENQGG